MRPHRFLPRTPHATLAAGLEAAQYPAEAVRAGERVFLSTQNALGGTAANGCAVAQTEAAIDRLEAALAAAGGTAKDVTKLTTSIVDRAHRRDVYATIRRRLPDVYPVSTGLIVAGLPAVEAMVQIDADALIPSGGAQVRRYRPTDHADWHGQGFAWQGAMVAAGAGELFVRGQTGSTLDGGAIVARGRRPQDAAAQADVAMANLAAVLEEAGCGIDDIAKITVYISDRAYRPAVYPVIGRHLRGVHPVSTGIIVQAFARPEILFEIDVQTFAKVNGAAHTRLRTYRSDAARYGSERQALDCDFAMAVRIGNRVLLRGQTGMGLDEVLKGAGDAVAQAEQAMDNVAVLLGEAGARLSDVVKASLYVTDRAYLAPVAAVVLRSLSGVAPAFGALIVKGLASPELLMEVDITAVIADASQ
jgi:enamine deaminase RidA (YjgF/YER057c/UK114 family)